jgi:hypothetical protein
MPFRKAILTITPCSHKHGRSCRAGGGTLQEFVKSTTRWFSVVKVAGLTFLRKCTWHGADGLVVLFFVSVVETGASRGMWRKGMVRGGGHGGRCGVLRVAETDVDEMFGSSEV